MKIKKITSLTALISFVFLILTSIILYIVPPGRVAYWADWHLWGLTKPQWGNIHINTGILFLLAIVFHIYYNWKLILSYLKSSTKKLKIFTKEFNVALILVMICLFGTYFEIVPFSSILSVSESFKDKGIKKYGEPPYGHAELSSLKLFTQRLGLDLEKSIALLKDAGYQIGGNNETLAEIARRHNVPPQQVFEIIKLTAESSIPSLQKKTGLPDNPPSGTGNLTINDLCSQHNLELKDIIIDLEKKGIKAKGDMTIRKIAEENNISPFDLYEKIKTAAQSKTIS
jgi:predicted DNA-binding protein YlxM (UPF0122 family)